VIPEKSSFFERPASAASIRMRSRQAAERYHSSLLLPSSFAVVLASAVLCRCSCFCRHLPLSLFLLSFAVVLVSAVILNEANDPGEFDLPQA
jgi:hypothetical protein